MVISCNFDFLQYFPPSEDYIPSTEYEPNKNFMETPKIALQNFPKDDTQNMYFIIRLLGKSSKRHFYQRGQKFREENYPRGYQYEILNTPKNTFIDIGPVNKEIQMPEGFGYTEKSGFSNANGTELTSNFYVSHPAFKIPLSSSNSTLAFSFHNFVLWDQLSDGILGAGWEKIAFVRMNSSNPLKITIPMTDYDPKIHKNIAYVTVYLEPDKSPTLNAYQAVFDGFEPRKIKGS